MSESLKCMAHRNSTFIEGNICNVNIHEFLINTYNKLFNLQISFNQSLSTNPENLSNKNLPFILYGSNKIDRGSVNSFLKRLTNIDFNLGLNEEMYLDDIQYSKLDFFILEKIILSDLQAYVDNYVYLKYLEKTSMFTKIFKFIYQPIRTLKAFFGDSKNFLHNAKHYGFTNTTDVITHFKINFFPYK